MKKIAHWVQPDLLILYRRINLFRFGCGRCIDVCPVNLNPIKLSAEKENKCTECISCAACSYVCPSGIDLSAKIKVQIADKIQK